MNAPETVKLTTVGATLTMHVQSCKDSTTGQYPDVEYIGTDVEGRLVRVNVPKVSSERQLGRIGLTNETAVGKTLTFSRDPNAKIPSKPFWGISVDNVAAISAARPNGNASKAKQGINLGHIPGLDDEPPPPDDAAPAGQPAHDAAKERLRSIFKLQEICFTHALKMAAIAEEKGVTVTLEGLSALTAQSMIEANRRGGF